MTDEKLWLYIENSQENYTTEIDEDTYRSMIEEDFFWKYEYDRTVDDIDIYDGWESGRMILKNPATGDLWAVGYHDSGSGFYIEHTMYLVKPYEYTQTGYKSMCEMRNPRKEI